MLCLPSVHISSKKTLTGSWNRRRVCCPSADPALKLPEDQRWAAAMHGKVRDHSEALHKGVCETLALLAVHGNHRFQQRLGIDVAAHIASLITELLTPLTVDKLLSHDRDLPLYAEAAPEQFLDVLEHDLRQVDPALQELLRPVTPGRWFEAPRRTGLLWALECLAWSPQHLPRASRILAQLAGTRIDDNWWPKPISSLEAIFHSWTPQTAAPLDDRIRCLKMLAREFPAVGWQICNTQLERHAIDVSSHRPRWRDCATDVSEVAEDEELAFIRSVLDLTMAWPEHDENTLGDLIEHLDGMSEQNRTGVWSLVDTWAETTADGKAKADLSERISRFVYSLRNSPGGLTVAIQEAARAARKRLLTSDPVIRHRWLFAKPWVAGFDDETDEAGDDHDWRKRDERVRELRSKAMGGDLGEPSMGGRSQASGRGRCSRGGRALRRSTSAESEQRRRDPSNLPVFRCRFGREAQWLHGRVHCVGSMPPRDRTSCGPRARPQPLIKQHVCSDARRWAVRRGVSSINRRKRSAMRTGAPCLLPVVTG